MTSEVLFDFILDLVLEHHQEESQLGPDVYFTIANHYAAVDTGPLEMNHVFVPAVLNAEFFRQVTGKLIGRLLSIRVFHSMKCPNINRRHHASRPVSVSGSLVCCGRDGQPKHGQPICSRNHP